MSPHKSLVLLLLPLLLLASSSSTAGTEVGYYSDSCPLTEVVVRDTVAAHFLLNPSVAPGLVRMHFHDCFVRGCDASVLLEGKSTERAFVANLGLHGFEVVEDAKSVLEALCPGIVSCADILALAARDSVSLTNGPYWEVPTGRRDGRVSNESEAAMLPSFTETVDALVAKFDAKGLDKEDLVALSGAHTIGKVGCKFFSYRLNNFTNSSQPDPTINPTYLARLQSLCSNQETRVNLDDQTPEKFDTAYFANLRTGKGVLESDQKLWTDSSTRFYAQGFLETNVFAVQFAKAMVKMGNIETLTAPDGEIRNVCSRIN